MTSTLNHLNSLRTAAQIERIQMEDGFIIYRTLDHSMEEGTQVEVTSSDGHTFTGEVAKVVGSLYCVSFS